MRNGGKVWNAMCGAGNSGNERILAAAADRRWLEEARLPSIRAALAALPDINAADLLHEQGIIDSAQRAWLQQHGRAEPREGEGEPLVDRCLEEALRQGASDLYLVPDRPPLCKRHGQLQSLDAEWDLLRVGQIEQILDRVLPPPERDELGRQGWTSLIYCGGGLRSKVTIGRDANGYFLSFRLPFPRPLELRELGIEEASTLAAIPSGLIIVAGGPGQGKSTFLAALARLCHRSRPGRLLLLEDLPEYPWEEPGPPIVRISLSKLVGKEEEVLRGAFSLDPDVLLLDASISLRTFPVLAEETLRSGALVVATLGLRGVEETLRALCAEMSGDQTRSLLVRTLRAILSMELISGAARRERLAAAESFRNAPEAAVALAKVKPEEIEQLLDRGRGKYYLPIDDALWRLFQQGRLSMETAYARCRYRSRWVARMHPPTFSGSS